MTAAASRPWWTFTFRRVIQRNVNGEALSIARCLSPSRRFGTQGKKKPATEDQLTTGALPKTKLPAAEDAMLLEQTKIGERKYPKFTPFPYLSTSVSPTPLYRSGTELRPTDNYHVPVSDLKEEFDNFEAPPGLSGGPETIISTWISTQHSILPSTGSSVKPQAPNICESAAHSQSSIWWQFYVRGENPDYPLRRQAFDYLWQRGINVYRLSISAIENWTRWVEIRKQGEYLQLQRQRAPFHPRFPYGITFERKIAQLRRVIPRTDPQWVQLQRTSQTNQS